MSSLLAMLSQQTPNLQTRKGLILLGLQNDFLSPDGKLPVSTKSGFVDRLKELVPAFREFGDVIWVRSEFEANRVVNVEEDNGCTVIAGSAVSDAVAATEGNGSKRKASQGSSVPMKRMKAAAVEEDEELFLTRTAGREPCCVKGSWGADYPVDIKALIDEKDMQVMKTYYSAFGSTSLLLTLRSKLITELYVCGCNTNLSVFATAMDAARYGISITLIEDCLGYRKRERHDEAIRQLVEIMEADVVTSEKVIDVLKNPPSDDEDDEEEEDDDEDDSEEEEPVGFGEDAPKARHLSALEVDSNEEEEEDEDAEPMVPNQRQRQHEPKLPLNVQNLRTLDFSTPAAVLSALANRTTARVTGAAPASSLSSSTPRSSHPGLAALSTPAGLSQRTTTDYEKAMPEAHQSRVAADAPPAASGKPLFGDDNEQESAGSRILYDLLPPELAVTIFEELKKEVKWQHMHHQTGEVPRLVCCQGDIDSEDGSRPVYRHPSDHTLPLRPWTPTVAKVRQAAEQCVGRPLNHALIQLYRGGADFISEHSDKTLDIVKGSSIVNVSFGAQRTMRLRTKRGATATSYSPSAVVPGEEATTPAASPGRTTYRVPLPHNSMITMSLPTNAEYLHGINADKRPGVEFADAEKACGGQRISLTFRHIGTFLSADEQRIWGQGATGKSKDEARRAISGDEAESEKLVRAFGAENQASGIRWEGVYGEGSDVLHLR
ncbi:hypothetical protein LTR85_011235 [Meristemomyces frigidus]|nr:hypothetical protein LTR85_011235 [Meristemomyces frigidus]